MKKIVYIFLMVFWVSCSGNLTESQKNSNKIRVEGQIVETYYSQDIIFSVLPLSEVRLRVNHDFVAETNREGKYSFYIHEAGQYHLFAEKNHYKTKSTVLSVIKGDRLKRDFYLERQDESSSTGWSPTPMPTGGGHVSITAEGLTIYSSGRDEVFATKTISLKNNRDYKFTASMKKDPLTHVIYFAVQPQMPGGIWKEDRTNLNNWRQGSISYFINDTTVIDMSYIYDDEGAIIDTVYVYPENVDVVLKIGVELGTDFPIGYFREIKVEGG